MIPILIHVSTVLFDRDDRVLFVREAKEIHRGMWNLPGGHLEFGERLIDAAKREVLEEVKIEVEIIGFLGIYTGRTPTLHSIRYVFRGLATNPARAPQPGDEILELRWMLPSEVLKMSDSELVGTPYLRQILQDILLRKEYPLEVITEVW